MGITPIFHRSTEELSYFTRARANRKWPSHSVSLTEGHWWLRAQLLVKPVNTGPARMASPIPQWSFEEVGSSSVPTVNSNQGGPLVPATLVSLTT